MQIDPVKGFRDFTGEDARKRDRIMQIIKDAFEVYGFEPAETPIVEYEEFIDNEMIHFSKYDCERSIPNMVDGLKTSVRRTIETLQSNGKPLPIADVCASVQNAIVEVLVEKTIRAAREHSVAAISISGGVSANSLLRTCMHETADKHGLTVVAPRLGYCVDNAAMIANVAMMRMQNGVQETAHTFTISPKSIRG